MPPGVAPRLPPRRAKRGHRWPGPGRNPAPSRRLRQPQLASRARTPKGAARYCPQADAAPKPRRVAYVLPPLIEVHTRTPCPRCSRRVHASTPAGRSLSAPAGWGARTYTPPRRWKARTRPTFAGRPLPAPADWEARTRAPAAARRSCSAMHSISPRSTHVSHRSTSSHSFSLSPSPLSSLPLSRVSPPGNPPFPISRHLCLESTPRHAELTHHPTLYAHLFD
jgi:hypothetical protein